MTLFEMTTKQRKKTVIKSPRVKSGRYAGMNEEDLLLTCRALYEKHGFEALTFKSLQSQGQLYMTLYHRGLSHSVLIEKLSLKDAYLAYQKDRPKKYGGKIRTPWTWERVVSEAKSAMENYGQLPPPLWFQKNGKGALIHFVYRSGKSWADLREAVGDFTDSKFVKSRNGLRWLSHAEASLSNFLYARGVEHKKGERYPDEITNVSDAKSAFYDAHLKTKDGNWLDVEVWGDNPLGHAPEKYARRRKAKEIFNQRNPRFIGIHHEACYSDAELTRILKPYIGTVKPFQFDKPTDQVIPSTHWSNADELLNYCKQLVLEMPDGTFPTEEWLRKRGKHAFRSGPAYNTLAVYIKQWLGGVRNLRSLLGQEVVNTRQWDAKSALSAYKKFVELYDITPGQALDKWHRKSDPAITEEIANEASRIATAASKYVGTMPEVHKQIDIAPTRLKWDAQAALEAYKEFFDIHGITPSQAVDYWYRKRTPLIKEEVAADARKILGAVKKYCGGITAAQKKLGI